MIIFLIVVMAVMSWGTLQEVILNNSLTTNEKIGGTVFILLVMVMMLVLSQKFLA